MALRVGTKADRERFKKLKDEIEKRHGKTTQELLDERERRMTDAIELRTPDRVPVTIQTGVFSARYAGIPLSAMYYDYRRHVRGNRVLLVSEILAPWQAQFKRHDGLTTMECHRA